MTRTFGAFLGLSLLSFQYEALRLLEGGKSKVQIDENAAYPINLGQVVKDLGIEFVPAGGQMPDSKPELMQITQFLNGGKVVIPKTGFTGAFGNLALQLSSAISFGLRVGVTTLELQAPIPAYTGFDLPEGTYSIENLKFSKDKGDCKNVDANAATSKGVRWWWVHCRQIPVAETRQILIEFLRPHMIPELTSCVAAKGEDDENLLTVHYRQQRLNQKCNLADLAKGHKNYSKVLVVTTVSKQEGQQDRGKNGAHPCVEQHEQRGDKIQMGSLVQDICTVMRAKNLVMSDSTFTEVLAMLSPNLKNLYRSAAGHWNPQMTGGWAVDWCTDSNGVLWEGTQLIEVNDGTSFTHSADMVFHPDHGRKPATKPLGISASPARICKQ